MAEENREAARRFVKASIDAYAFMKNNKEATLKGQIEKWYNVKDRAQQENMYKPSRNADEALSVGFRIKQVMALYTYRELKKAKPEDFYDASFITELDKSGYIDSVYKKYKVSKPGLFAGAREFVPLAIIRRQELLNRRLPAERFGR